ncbi:hypothetical protein [Polaribacter glomeratus]|uniref:Uncharacterized protein n=1 Tax=Polaribacter glomeratus TaxID=102 RepID=A0A2S7WFV5_9FLAO|nr:hypothetical protein [Polaribacter glomeratus]PQJ76490.1 hypothetical protein BTO16_11330 [Polaribacter glomeratus]TXD64213.1 hypothetical protein ESX12_15995 [Polaribacter glomeratus]
MKSKKQNLWLFGVPELIAFTEKGLVDAIDYSKKVKDRIFNKVHQKAIKTKEKRQQKKRLLEKGIEDDGAIAAAQYLEKRNKSIVIPKNRLQDLEKIEEHSTLHKEMEQER